MRFFLSAKSDPAHWRPLNSCDQLDFIIVLQLWWVGLSGSVDTPIRMGAKFLLCPCPTPSFVLLVSVWVPYLSLAYGTVPYIRLNGSKIHEIQDGDGELMHSLSGTYLVRNPLIAKFLFFFFNYSFSFYLLLFLCAKNWICK